MSNLPNSTIRLVPPTLRGGYCPDSWTEFARTIVGGTSAQINLDRGSTFYNFGNVPVFPTPSTPCDYDLLMDVEPSATDFSNKIGWISVNELETTNGVTDLVLGASGTIDTSYAFAFNTGLERVSIPNATTLVPGPLGSSLSFQQMVSLLEIEATSVTSTALLRIRDNPLLTSVSLPALTGGYHYVWSGGSPVITLFIIRDNPALTDIDLGSFVPDSYSPNREHQANFSGNALTAASVNHILARFVANAAWGAQNPLLDLSGGTNAAPTGQGIVDKATLIGRGANVLTN